MKKLFLAVCFAVLFSPRVKADFEIVLNYTGDAQYLPLFENAAATWESLLTGYQDGLVVTRFAGSSYNIGDTVDRVFIDAAIDMIDGPDGALAEARPTSAIVDSSNFILATNGEMTFDEDDVPGLAASSFEDIILHEMGHVLGFGTLWDLNGVYAGPGVGEYTGARATLAWQNEFGQMGTPDVELGGGLGTADGHWNEIDEGAGLTGITDNQGRDLAFELMTGWFNGNAFISNMTVQSFVDIGFTAIPEPGSGSLFMLALLLTTSRRRIQY
ncbi:MAG: PEP-CTERM sorting domain-containing protein [Planctomycetota bacterium]